MRKLLTFWCIVLIVFSGKTQDDPYEIENYPFINQTKNKFEIFDSLAYEQLFEKLTDIGFQGKNKVRIVHIGDSHLQADFLSGNFRKRLQTFFLGAMGGRGFIFPYKVAKTNNPLNFKVKSEGSWESCKNVETKLVCDIGLAGITVFTKDTLATITINIEDASLPGYDFDRLMIFHDFGDEFYHPQIDNANASKAFHSFGYTLFEFDKNIDRVELQLKKTSAEQSKFNLYGFNFDSNDAGIIYHTVGVNGAQYESYLKCKYFEPHLSALTPDWVIISLGTNDCYTNVFDSIAFAENVDIFIQSVKKASPKATILLTTPGDHRLKRSFINENVRIASEIIKNKAKAYQLSYWDFYAVMGGEGSVNHWYYNGMAHTDYLHLTKKGYQYQAQLLFNAFLKAYDGYLEKEILKKN